MTQATTKNTATLNHLSQTDWLPYNLPQATSEQAKFLSKVLKVPAYCKATTEADVSLMVMTLLYPHLDSTDQKAVFPRYQQHPNRPLAEFLRIEVVMYTKVQRSRGIWSKPTSELESRIKANKRINKALELAGASSFIDLVKSAVKEKKLKPYVVVLSIIYGGTSVSLKEAENEREYRLSGGKVGDFSFQ